MSNTNFFELVEAFLDDELEPQLQQQFEKELLCNEALQKEVHENKELRRLIREHFEHEALLEEIRNWYDNNEMEKTFQESLIPKFSLAEKIISISWAGLLLLLIIGIFTSLEKPTIIPINPIEKESNSNNPTNPQENNSAQKKDPIENSNTYQSKTNNSCLLVDDKKLLKLITDTAFRRFSETIIDTKLNIQTMSSTSINSNTKLREIKIKVDKNEISFQNALFELEKITIEAPDSMIALQLKIYFYYKSNNLKMAIDSYKKFTEIDTNVYTDKFWYELMLYLSDSKKYERELCKLWESSKDESEIIKKVQEIESQYKIKLFKQ